MSNPTSLLAPIDASPEGAMLKVKQQHSATVIAESLVKGL